MFLGTFEYTIDPKGRLFIPAKLREGNSKNGKYILTKGLELCLYLYNADDFHDKVIAKLSALPVKNQQDGRAFKRMLLAGAQEVELDNMGRILIPDSLFEFAQLKKDVSILGVGERVELWSTVKWKEYSRKASATFQRMGKQLEI
jgi:MraZ protein